MRLRLGDRDLSMDRSVAVMAVVNRTADSFYAPARHPDLSEAVEHALRQVADGADIVDVGAVKAGPGDPVDPDEERRRLVGFVGAFRARCDAPLSVETWRPQVAAAALDAGADLVNDVSGMADPAIADVVAARPGTALVVMHAGGPPRTRPFRPTYRPDVTSVVVETCARLTAEARRRGVGADAIVVDPGHDFAKNTFQSLEVTRRLGDLCALGYPVLVSLSRKDFLGETLGGVPPEERLEASLAAVVASVMLGARLVRVHDTAATVRAVRTVEAILGWRPPATAARGLE